MTVKQAAIKRLAAQASGRLVYAHLQRAATEDRRGVFGYQSRVRTASGQLTS